MRSVWVENLVVDAMASEACCLLKANLSGEPTSLLQWNSCGLFVATHQVNRFCEQKTPLDSSSRAVRNSRFEFTRWSVGSHAPSPLIAGLRSFACVRNVVVLILDTTDFSAHADATPET